MKELIHPLDPYQMNWIEGVQEWGNIKQLPQELEVRAETEFQDEVIHQRFIFTNTSSKYLFTARDSIGIYTPLMTITTLQNSVCTIAATPISSAAAM